MSQDDQRETAGDTEDDRSEGAESFEGSDDPKVISDDQLPEDLRPTDDNPLAKPEGEDDDGQGGGMNVQEEAAGGAPPV